MQTWAIIVIVVVWVIMGLAVLNHYANPPKCPKCSQPIRASIFMFQNTEFRCTCGTKVTLAPGIFTNNVVDWTEPGE